MRQIFRMLKGAIVLLLSGAAAGAYLQYQYVYIPMKQDIAAGWCGKVDHRQRYFEFACQDAFIAATLAQHDIEEDAIGAKITQVDAEMPKARKHK